MPGDGVEGGPLNTEQQKNFSNMIPGPAKSDITNDPNSGYGFYNKYGQIANPDTAHEIANTTIEAEEKLLQQYEETVSEVASLKGGYLEAARVFAEKYPDLCTIVRPNWNHRSYTESLMNPEKWKKSTPPEYVVSNTIQGDGKIRNIIFCRSSVWGLIHKEKEKDPKNNERERFVDKMESIGGNVLPSRFIDSSKQPRVYLNRELSSVHGPSSYYLQNLTQDPSSIKKALSSLVTERNEAEEDSFKQGVQTLKEELSGL